jgi:hypothetical protein
MTGRQIGTEMAKADKEIVPEPSTSFSNEA